MITIQKFTFGPFQESSYVLYDETKECVIIDPGCMFPQEKETLSAFIADAQLTPVRLLNTHCHVDHIAGNKYVSDTYALDLEANENDGFLIDSQMKMANTYGLPAEQSPQIVKFINEGDVVAFGNSSLEAIHVPGHSPGSIVFYSAQDGFMVVGDVLFAGSVGRSDLPGGNHEQLIAGIKGKLLPKPDEVEVHSGHGPVTTIGAERSSNPYL